MINNYFPTPLPGTPSGRLQTLSFTSTTFRPRKSWRIISFISTTTKRLIWNIYSGKSSIVEFANQIRFAMFVKNFTKLKVPSNLKVHLHKDNASQVYANSLKLLTFSNSNFIAMVTICTVQTPLKVHFHASPISVKWGKNTAT